MGRTLAPPTVTVEDAPMRFDHAVDQFVADKWLTGHFTSLTTDEEYRRTLNDHAEDVGYRDPANTTREHVMVTLHRYSHLSTNTVRLRLTHMRSFYKWCMQSGIRKDNPADQVPTPRATKPDVYRMTRAEVQRFLAAAQTVREKRVAFLGVCAGVRNAELRKLQGRHFRRPGFVWVSADIAKGGRERWIPVIGDLAAVWQEIAENVADDEYVLPAERFRDPGLNRQRMSKKRTPASRQVLRTVVTTLGERAQIAAHITPHLMRHAFGDHFARYTDLHGAQHMLGHQNVSTTQQFYKGGVTHDELTRMAQGFTFLGEQVFPTPPNHPDIAREAPTRIELVDGPSRDSNREATNSEGAPNGSQTRDG